MEMHSLQYARGLSSQETAALVGGATLSEEAVGILEQLHRTITDFRELEKRGQQQTQEERERERELGQGRTLGTGDKEGDERDKKKNGKKGKPKPGKMSLRKEFAMKARWAIVVRVTAQAHFDTTFGLPQKSSKYDKDKFVDLLHDLKDYNDGLYKLFPAYRHESLSRQLTHDVLYSAERSVSDLSLIEHASNGQYPLLNASASLKELKVNLESKSQTAFKATIAFRIPKESLTVAEGSTNTPPTMRSDKNQRIPAYHKDKGNVLIEWIDYDTHERNLHMRRLDDLTRLMHSASDCHPDLHTIDCVGYTEDQPKSRFGLVYKAPESTFSSLYSLISVNDLKTPDLQDRMALAKTLAIALWSLHSLEWLHKSFCSSILFFLSAMSASAKSATALSALVPDISSPYLVGFDASRSDLDTEVSLVSRNPSIHDLHRHPNLIGCTTKRVQYIKSHDIYSLGLILLEVGLWKVLQTFHKPSYSAERWRDRVVLNALVPGLGSKAGKMYREVVEKCLQVKEDMGNDEACLLMEEIVKTLEIIRV
ncbi:prion-inhibition and propagation-domain-containing protein [Zalerion maritima]|uniref:Prion-inhibition and propagation-domain-containing protein n=1 Tax=Zalerion maritima TaxID=339359 RepID=A0AAD5RGZ0_9PEZI|nr:prion-inhibition and propagation-domain-containing protein [Zalerion maritima]